MERIINKQNYEAYADDRLAVVKIKENVFDLITNRGNVNDFVGIMNHFQYEAKYKAVLFINESGCFGEDIYDKFIKKLSISFNEDNRFELPNFCDKMLRSKELLMLGELVRYLSSYKKLCFIVG